MPATAPVQAIADVHATVEAYYTGRVVKYGATPLGVDWTCVATQELRFVQLLKLCDFASPLSLNDLGCGYGALLAFIAKRFGDVAVDYCGVDLSAPMIEHAQSLFGAREGVAFHRGDGCPRVADYSVASGVFNVKLTHTVAEWERFVAETLRGLRRASRRGFAVNFMAPIEPARANPMLYRTRSEPWLAFCKDELGGSATVIGDYGLREFTLLVR